MRLKAEAVFELWADDEQPQIAIVSEYRGEYKAISEILDEQGALRGLYLARFL